MKYVVRAPMNGYRLFEGKGSAYLSSMKMWDASWDAKLSKAMLFDTYEEADKLRSSNVLFDEAAEVVSITDEAYFKAKLANE